MANRRIEVHHYREVLYRVRQGQSLRAIDRAKLMGRRKAQRLISMAQPLGWLDPAVELPDNATIFKRCTTIVNKPRSPLSVARRLLLKST